jgi:hypothetical protein
MNIRSIRGLELRREAIPRCPAIEAIEEITGQAVTEEIRHYLEDQPVHCGNTLELYRNGQWLGGRYEWTGNAEDMPTFHTGTETLALDESALLRWPTVS